MKNFHQIKVLVTGLLLSSVVVPVVIADDIEIYTTPGSASAIANPNILFMVDNSISMEAKTWVKPDYDKSTAYAGSCQTDGIYFVDSGVTPDCSVANEDWFKRSALVCDHALVGYEADGTKKSPGEDGSLLMIGTYSDQLAQFEPVSKQWREFVIKSAAAATGRDYLVECFSDNGNSTANGNNNEYIIDGGTGYTATAPADPDNPHPVWSGGAGNLQLFDGNYLNYLEWVPIFDPLNPTVGERVEKTRLEQVQRAVEIMVRGNTRVDIGLMVFDDKNKEGGGIMYPILDVGASRNDFYQALGKLNPTAGTQLSETYYEALLYYGGEAIDFGKQANPPLEGSATLPGQVYKSPITGECDRNFIVVLSDGSPTFDDVSEARQKNLTGFDAGSCSTDITVSIWDDDNRDAYLDTDADKIAGTTENLRVSTIDNCLDELAGWAFTNDVAEIGSITAHDGKQHIITHTIGWELSGLDKWGLDLDAASELLKDTAHRGGGEFYQASDQASLIDIFNKIIAGALGINTSFSSPAVSVNAFNRSTHLDDLYFTLFEPAMTNHWNGNLKKYKLKFAVDTKDKDGDGDITEKLPFIADKQGVSAIDPDTGFFDVGSTSSWSTVVDGKDVVLGGAVGGLTTTRNVYTFTGTYAANTTGVNQPSDGALDIASNAVDPTNTSLTDALLGTTGFPDIVTGDTYRETLIDWASGLDALGEFGSVATDVRPQMGDPLHAEPALVQYGKTVVAGVTVPDLTAYVATNDGYLHAFDVNTGEELFSFIPQELLTNLPEIMENNRANKTYGLDGSVVAWVNDDNGDGEISGAGEHVYLYFGMRRGGNNIYSLDVTDNTKPKLRWVIKGGTGDYTELGQTWSTINVEKVKDGAAEKTVLIFGGGYATAQDGKVLRTPDSVGRTVYIADADTGLRLWSAGKDGASPVTDMEYSIPARIKPLDISGDGFIDRLYAADTGGQIFRFDINNTNANPLASSITGGRIVDIAGAAAEDNRRFYYPPDVALVNAPDGKYHGLVISSGYRAHPLNEVIHDRIYMIKDRNTGLLTSNADYKYDPNSSTTIGSLTEANLHNVTANLAGGDSGVKGNAVADAARDVELTNIANAEGWYIDLEDEANPGTWIGEKGLAEPLIIEGVAIVSTYTPNVKAGKDVCGPNEGIGKVFFLDILDATPAFPSNVDLRPERHIQLVRGGIPPTPGGIITPGGEPTICVGTECRAADLGLGVRKTYWYEVEK